jgi:hypothetical protein
MVGLGLERAGEVVNVTLAPANDTEVSHGHRVCVDVHADSKRARLAHG